MPVKVTEQDWTPGSKVQVFGGGDNWYTVVGSCENSEGGPDIQILERETKTLGLGNTVETIYADYLSYF